MIGCSSENWYHVKAHCAQRGGTLAILNTDKKRIAILNLIVERKLFHDCGWLYIGLRKEDWWISGSQNFTGLSHINPQLSF